MGFEAMKDGWVDLGLERSFTRSPARISVGNAPYYLVLDKGDYQLLSAVCPHQGGTVAEAAISGNIRQVTTVERQRQAYLWPLFWKTRTVVTGNGPSPVVVQTQPGNFQIKPGPVFTPQLHPTTGASGAIPPVGPASP